MHKAHRGPAPCQSTLPEITACKVRTAIGVENFEIETVLLEDSGALADVGKAAVPLFGALTPA